MQALSVDQQLFDSQAFSHELTQSTQPIRVFRKALKQGHEVLQQRFDKNFSGERYVAGRVWLVDNILLHAWGLCPGIDNAKLALVAGGGYGRGELHPASDIDLMVLHQDVLDETTQHCVERFLTFLWDIGLEVGSSVRNLEQCRIAAADDITVLTNLIEARLLSGNAQLFTQMQVCVGPDKLWSSKDFFEAKLAEQQRRHAKYHDTTYNLEPNLKEGLGGLRDIQMIGWVAKRHFGAQSLYDLVRHGFLTEDEYKTLITEQEFLWRIRCLLHHIARRAEDRLLFDYQRQIAEILGYKGDEQRLGVEKFMHQYYRAVMEISLLNEMLLQLFQEAILYAGPMKVEPINRRFQIRNDFIEVTHDKVFAQYPFALLEIFMLIQEHPQIRGIRASTGRLLRHYKHLIDKAFHDDLRSRSLFYEILRQTRGQTRAFRLMNRYGILGAYIPAFGKIVGQMQHDLFHVYTVDQHTLFVLRNLRRFTVPKYYDEFPLCSEVIQRIPKLELLYLAGLFHDIAKGRGGDHSVLGEADALEFCQLHGLSGEDSRLVAWLTRNHLVMSATAQRQDTSDPAVINAFAQKIEEIQRLDYLYLLTVADIRGTNPTLWNSWKNALLTDLYHKTRYALLAGLENPVDKQVRVSEIRDEALRLLPETIDPAAILALWSQIDEDYFLRTLAADIAKETGAILANQPPLALLREHTPGGTGFLIYAQDNEFLFANTTLYLEQQGITVVDAFVTTTLDGYTMLGFTVLEANNQMIDSPQRMEELRAGLAAISSQSQPNYSQINRRLSRQAQHFQIPTRVTFDKDLTRNDTIMEVITTDRPGVLSRIAQAMANCRVRLKSAKIATLGSRVEDIFYISDWDNKPLYSPNEFDCLQEQLFALLDKGAAS